MSLRLVIKLWSFEWTLNTRLHSISIAVRVDILVGLRLDKSSWLCEYWIHSGEVGESELLNQSPVIFDDNEQ